MSHDLAKIQKKIKLKRHIQEVKAAKNGAAN